MAGRVLQIYRDGRRSRGGTIQLPPGAQANLQTMHVMARIVREDAQIPSLRNFVMREIIGLEKTSLTDQVDAAFTFCRDQIVYEPEGQGTETVADLWSCMYGINPVHPVGDCAVKSVALATCLAFLNVKPFFVAIRQLPNVDYFNHVFVGINEGGKDIALDPTPENFQIGQQLGYLQRVNFVIFT
jgi:hypothetical protein